MFRLCFHFQASPFFIVEKCNIIPLVGHFIDFFNDDNMNGITISKKRFAGIVQMINDSKQFKEKLHDNTEWITFIVDSVTYIVNDDDGDAIPEVRLWLSIEDVN